MPPEVPILGGAPGAPVDTTAFFKSASTAASGLDVFEKKITGLVSLLDKFEVSLRSALGVMSGVGQGKQVGTTVLPSHWPLQPYLSPNQLPMTVPGGGTYGPPVPTPSAPQQQDPTQSFFSKYMKRGAEFSAGLGVVGGMVGSAYLKRAEPVFGNAPGLSTLAAYAGLPPTSGAARNVAGNLQTGYAQSLSDTVQANLVASHFAGQSYLGGRSQAYIKNAQEIVRANPGMSLNDAAQAYASLLSPASVNRLGKLYGTGPVKIGGGYSDFNSLAQAVVTQANRGVTPSISRAQSIFQPGGGAYTQLTQAAGGQAQADLLLNQFYTGGNAGGNNAVIAAQRKAGESAAKNQSDFYRHQDKQFSHLITINTRMEKDISQALSHSGPLGILSAEMSKFIGAAEKLVIIAGILAKVFGVNVGGIASSIGEAVTGGGAAAGSSGALAAGGALVAGVAAGEVVKHNTHATSKSWFSRAGYASTHFTRGGSWGTPGGPRLNPFGHGGIVPIGDPAPMSMPDQQAITTLEHVNHASAGDSGVLGLNPSFRDKVAAMFAANPRLTLNSGYRSVAQQTRLWNDAVKKYGSAAAARKWVAPPGNSMHNRGLAVDIGPSSEYGWLKANAPKYGLWNYPPEPWHWEPAGARSGAYSSGDGGTSTSGSSAAATLTGASMSATPMGAGTGTAFSTQSDILAAHGVSGSGGGVVMPGGLSYNTGPSIQGVAGGSVQGSPGGSSGGGTAPSKNMQDFINTILPFAREQSRRTGIPVSVFLAQSGDETGWGTSSAWRHHLNPAGIDITGPGVSGGSYPSMGAAFQSYANRLSGIGERGQGPFMSLVRQHAPTLSILQALEASPWAAGHYGGHGLENIYKNYNLGRYDVGDPSLSSGAGRSHRTVHNHFQVIVPNATEREAIKLVALVMKKLKQQEDDDALASA